MSDSDHLEALVRLFHSAPVNQAIFLNSELSLSKGQATYQLEVRQAYFHGAEAMHGAVYFKLLDDAAYFASATLEDEYFLVTKSYELQFIRPVALERLTATGEVVEVRGHEILAESEIKNDRGKTVAKGRGVFVRSRKKLSELEGYV